MQVVVALMFIASTAAWIASYWPMSIRFVGGSRFHASLDFGSGLVCAGVGWIVSPPGIPLAPRTGPRWTITRTRTNQDRVLPYLIRIRPYRQPSFGVFSSRGVHLEIQATALWGLLGALPCCFVFILPAVRRHFAMDSIKYVNANKSGGAPTP